MSVNDVQIAGADEINYYFRNYSYANMLSDLPILSMGLATDLNRLIYKNAVGGDYKIMLDASTTANLADDRVMVTSGGGLADVSGITTTELTTLQGIDSNIQNQLDAQNLWEVSGTSLSPLSPQTSIKLPGISAPTQSEGLLYYDNNLHCYTYFNDVTGSSMQIGREEWIRAQNETGTTLNNGDVVYISGWGTQHPEISLASNTEKLQSEGVLGIVTATIADANEGEVVRFGRAGDIDTTGETSGAPVYLGINGAWTTTRPNAPDYVVRLGVIGEVGASGSLVLDVSPFIGSDTDVNIEGALNGIVVDTPSVNFVVDGGVVYADVTNETNPTKKIPVMLGGERYLLDTLTGSGASGAARIALTSGTSSVPQPNFIYVELSGNTAVLGASTTYPSGTKAWIGGVSLKDVATTTADGVLAWRRHNNAPNNGDGDGYYNYIAQRIRLEGSKWESGVIPTVAITNAGLNVNVTTTSGIAWQLHRQTFDSTDGTEYYVVNHPTDGVKKITDLNELLVDANGNAIANDDIAGFNLFGCQSSSGGTDRVLITLPEAFYPKSLTDEDDQAIADSLNYAITSIPAGLGLDKISFRICRLVLRYNTGGVWDNVVTEVTGDDYQDERGLPQGAISGGGGGTSAVTDFSDADFSWYNNADATKVVDVDLSGLTSGTTRTLTMPDASGTIALTSDALWTQSGDDIYRDSNVTVGSSTVRTWLDGMDYIQLGNYDYWHTLPTDSPTSFLLSNAYVNASGNIVSLGGGGFENVGRLSVTNDSVSMGFGVGDGVNDTTITTQAIINSSGLQLSTGATINEFSTDGTLAGNSDTAVPTEKSVKTYFDDNQLWETDGTALSPLGSEYGIAITNTATGSESNKPVLDLDVAIGGAGNGIVIDRTAEHTAGGSRYTSIDFKDYGTIIGQFFGLGSTYTGTLGANNIGLFAEAAGASLILGSGTSTGKVNIVAGGYSLSSDTILEISSTGAELVKGSFLLNNDNQAIKFGASDDASILFDGADFVFDIETAGDFVFSGGNVGIDYNSGTSQFYLNGVDGNVSANLFMDSAFGVNLIATRGGGGVKIGATATTSNTFISLITENTERMRIDSDGNVTMPEVYSDTITGTYKNLVIKSDGQLGVESPSWTSLSLTNCASRTGRTAGYTKSADGTVFLRGSVTASNASPGTATLPVGYRPSQKLYLTNVNEGTAPTTYITIDTDGTIDFRISAGGATTATIDGITFNIA